MKASAAQLLFPVMQPGIEFSAGCPDLARSSPVFLFLQVTIATHGEPAVTQSATW